MTEGKQIVWREGEVDQIKEFIWQAREMVHIGRDPKGERRELVCVGDKLMEMGVSCSGFKECVEMSK